MFHRGLKRPRFSVGGHSVFGHDDSSNHSGMGLVDYEDDSSSQQHNSSDLNYSFGHFAPDRPRRAHKSLTKSFPEDKTNLNACLDHLLRILSRKDKEGFFQYPVTDQFAPGYSQIILHPMDFSTMKRKISQDDYSNLVEFRSDFELMCDNAMKYNRPDTIYWQAAKKLLATGTKLMNKEKLLSLRRSVECFSRLTERELGFRIEPSNHSADEQISTSNDQFETSINDSESLSSISISQACSQRKPKLILKLPKFYDKVPPPPSTTTTVISYEEDQEEEEEEELPAEEILAQAQQAAQSAHEKLISRRLVSSYTLAYQRIRSSTSLNFINQDDYSEQTIALGEINHDDDKSAKHLLENGPFSSNASQYDSPFSSISKDELEVLIQTYGSEFSAQYAVSLMDYVKDSGDLALAYVDRFLSVLTNGEHDNFVLKKREKQEKDNTEKPAEIKLEPSSNQESKLLMELPETQYDNLSQLPTQQTNEYDLNDKVLFNLSDINGPEQLISSDHLSNDPSFDTL